MEQVNRRLERAYAASLVAATAAAAGVMVALWIRLDAGPGALVAAGMTTWIVATALLRASVLRRSRARAWEALALAGDDPGRADSARAAGLELVADVLARRPATPARRP